MVKLYSLCYINGTKNRQIIPICTTRKKIALEERMGKKLKDVKSFTNSTKNTKKTIAYFKDKSHKPKKDFESYKTLSTILESVDTIVMMGATSKSTTVLIVRIELIVYHIQLEMGVLCH